MLVLRYDSVVGRGFLFSTFKTLYSATKRRFLPCGPVHRFVPKQPESKVKAGVFSFTGVNSKRATIA